MGDFSSLMDIIIIVGGAYIAYAAILLKLTGEIKESVLLGKTMNIRKCKDLEGFKKFLFPRALAMGIFTVLFGIAGIINTKVAPLGNLYFVLLGVLMVILIWYFLEYRKGIRRYWGE